LEVAKRKSSRMRADWPRAEVKRVGAVCEVLAQGKASYITVLRIGELTTLTDYLIICSGATKIQVRAIAERLRTKMKEQGATLLNLEGYKEGLWVVGDLGDIMVHIFEEETREFYSLERLWGDAPQYHFEG